MAKKPTARQLKFVDLYLCDPERNASKAYREAGFKSKNPDVDAAKLLVNPSIQPLIEKRVNDIQEIAEKKFNLTQEKIIESYCKIAFSTPMDFLEWKDGALVYRKDIRPEEFEGLNFTIYPEYQTKVDKAKGQIRARLSLLGGNREAALEVLSKHTDLWSKLNGKNGSGNLGRDPKAALARISELVRKRRK